MTNFTLESTDEVVTLSGVAFRLYFGRDAYGMPLCMLVSGIVVGGGALFFLGGTALEGHEPLAGPMALTDAEARVLASAVHRVFLANGLSDPTLDARLDLDPVG